MTRRKYSYDTPRKAKPSRQKHQEASVSDDADEGGTGKSDKDTGVLTRERVASSDKVSSLDVPMFSRELPLRAQSRNCTPVKTVGAPTSRLAMCHCLSLTTACSAKVQRQSRSPLTRVESRSKSRETSGCEDSAALEDLLIL